MMSKRFGKDGTIWKRLSDRTKFPRSLWYPVIEPLGHDTEEDWQSDFNDVSTTVRRSMFTLLAYTGFCMVALGQPDEQILKTSGFKLPVIGSTVTVEGFMLMGPLLLIVLTFYLHIFVGRLRALKEGTARDNLSPPYLFNLRKRTTRILTALIFYWLSPLILFSFAFKGAPFLDDLWKDVLLFVLATFTTVTIALLAIRRRPEDRRRARNWFAWGLILFMIFLWFEPQLTERAPVVVTDDGKTVVNREGESITARPMTLDPRFNFIKPKGRKWPKLQFLILRRSLMLERADFTGMKFRAKDFSGARLQYAELKDSDLREANLSGADLTDADLTDADLRGANLSGADLTDADLRSADLRGANLSSADLTGALLRFADLTGADLWDADLTNAHLTDADLFRADLTNADVTDAWLWGAMVTCEQLKTSSGVPESIPAGLSDCMPQHAPPKPIPHGPFPITP